MKDERLARRAAAGDQAAFEAIFRRYHQDLYRFCLATVGNPQDAQDALQNTMVKALRSLPGEEREIKLKPWLYRIARNESVEMLRRRRDSVELKPEQADSMPETVETAAMRDRLRRLLGDLEELPERQRATLTMRELAGLDFTEIGDALDTSAAVARQALYEARLSLRQMEAGREMHCETVTRALSDGDGRVTRRRDVRAHLRGCAECRAFRDGIAARRDELRAIAPLPLAASAAVLHGVVGGGAAVATSAIVKSAATVAIVAAVGVTAADRGGLIEVPLPGRDGSGNVEATGPPDGATPGSSAGSPPAAADGRQGATGGANVRGSVDTAISAGKDGAGGGERAAEEPHSSGEQPSAATQGPDPAPGQKPGDPGRDEPLPAASSHGQQTAAAHKAPQANRSPGTPRSRGGDRSSGGASAQGRVKPPPATPPQSHGPPPHSGPPKTISPDKPVPGPFEADEPAAEPPAGKSKEAR